MKNIYIEDIEVTLENKRPVNESFKILVEKINEIVEYINNREQK